MERRVEQGVTVAWIFEVGLKSGEKVVYTMDNIDGASIYCGDELLLGEG